MGLQRYADRMGYAGFGIYRDGNGRWVKADESESEIERLTSILRDTCTSNDNLQARYVEQEQRIEMLEGHLNFIGWSSEGIAQAQKRIEMLEAVLQNLKIRIANIEIIKQIDQALKDGE